MLSQVNTFENTVFCVIVWTVKTEVFENYDVCLNNVANCSGRMYVNTGMCCHSLLNMLLCLIFILHSYKDDTKFVRNCCAVAKHEGIWVLDHTWSGD